MRKILLLAAISLCSLTSCVHIGPKSGVDKISSIVNEMVAKKVSEKLGKTAIDVPYSYDLSIIGDLQYKDLTSGKLSLELKGSNHVSGDLLSSKMIAIDGLTGDLDVKGEVDILGIKLDIDEHFTL